MPSITIAKNQKQQVEVGSVDPSGNRTNDPVSGASVSSTDPGKLRVEVGIETGFIFLIPQPGAADNDTVTVSTSATVTVNGTQVSFSSTTTVTITPAVDATSGIDLFPVGLPEMQ